MCSCLTVPVLLAAIKPVTGLACAVVITVKVVELRRVVLVGKVYRCHRDLLLAGHAAGLGTQPPPRTDFPMQMCRARSARSLLTYLTMGATARHSTFTPGIHTLPVTLARFASKFGVTHRSGTSFQNGTSVSEKLVAAAAAGSTSSHPYLPCSAAPARCLNTVNRHSIAGSRRMGGVATEASAKGTSGTSCVFPPEVGLDNEKWEVHACMRATHVHGRHRHVFRSRVLTGIGQGL